MDDRIRSLVERMDLNPPATEELLAAIQSKAGVALPADYLDFMREANGAEGFVGESYLQLWPVEDIAPSNERLKVARRAPGLLLFASDGGDTAFAFDTRSHPATYVDVPFIPIDLEEITPRGHTFIEFLEILSAGLEW